MVKQLVQKHCNVGFCYRIHYDITPFLESVLKIRRDRRPVDAPYLRVERQRKGLKINQGDGNSKGATDQGNGDNNGVQI